jgi:hypothetical protein
MESLGETTGECAGLGSGDFCRDMLKGWISCETQSDAQFFRRYLKVLGVGVGMLSLLEGCKWLLEALGVDKLPKA